MQKQSWMDITTNLVCLDCVVWVQMTLISNQVNLKVADVPVGKPDLSLVIDILDFVFNLLLL